MRTTKSDRAFLTGIGVGVGVSALAVALWYLAEKQLYHRRHCLIPVGGPMTHATTARSSADHELGAPGQNEQERLDEAIDETFPASDPISLHIE